MTSRSSPPRDPTPAGGSPAGTCAVGTSAADDDTPRPRRWLVYALVATALLMMSVDQTSVATALSALQADLGSSLALISWTLSAYSVGSIVAFPLAGLLADRLGRKAVFLGAIALFTLASIACGFAQGIESLVGFRVVQGFAGGAFVPAGTGIVADQFRRDRDRAVGLFASIVPVGAVAGPLVGGVLVTTTGWRGVFLVNAPLGVALLAGVAVLVPELPRRETRRLDWGGVFLLLAMLLSGMSAAMLASTPSPGTTAVAALALLGSAAVAAAWLLLRHIARHPDPFVPMSLLRGRGFGAIHVVNVLFGAGALGLVALLPHYAETRFGFSPVVAGGLLALRAFGMMGASAVGVALIRRLGYRPLLLAGFVVHSGGLLVLALPPPAVDLPLWLGAGAVVSGAGAGLASPASNNAAMHLAPDQVSSISGIRGMFRQGGAILAVAGISAVVSASSDPAGAQTACFAVLAVGLLVAVPVALRVPNHRGRW